MSISRGEGSALVSRDALPWVGGGCLVGILFLLGIHGLPAKWFYFLFFSVISGGLALLPSDRRSLFLWALVFTLPLGIDVNLYFLQSHFHHATYGFLITLYQIPLFALIITRLISSYFGNESTPALSTRGMFALFCFFVTGLVSILHGENFIFGFFDLFALAGSIVLFVYVSSDVVNRNDLNVIVSGFVAALFFQAAIALAQHATDSTLGLEFLGAYTSSELKGDTYRGLASLTRVGGTIGHPNALALFFDLNIPIALCLLFSDISPRMKVITAGVFVTSFAGLIVTLSRGGIITTSLVSGFLFLLRYKDKIGIFRAVLIMSILGTFVLFSALNPSGMVYKRFVKDDYQAAATRLPLMKVALNMIKANPVLGVGLNNYNEMATKYDTTPERISSSWNAPVHNLFLYITSQVGIVGILFYFMFIGSVFWGLWPAVKSGDPFIRWVGRGSACGLVGYFLHAQIEFVNFTHETTFWFMCGFAVALGRMARHSPPQIPEHSI